MAIAKYTHLQYDVCIIYDDTSDQKKVREDIVAELEKRGVTICDTEVDGTPGRPQLQNIIHLLGISKCAIIVHPIAGSFIDLLKLIQKLFVLSKHCIALSLDSVHANYGPCIIDISTTPEWLEQVLCEIRTSSCAPCPKQPVEIIFKVPQPTCFLDQIFRSGHHSISSVDMNILGIKIMPSLKEVKLDLTHCVENIERHEHLQTDQMVEMFHFLRSMSTQVELRIDGDTDDIIEIVSRTVDKIFATICSCVLDVRGRKLRDWILAYTLSGPLIVGRRLLARIYHASRHAVIGSAFPNEIQHPEYADEQLRIDSFTDTVFGHKAEAMADAGFYFDGLHDRARCFHCGGARVGWKESDDPWYRHAEGFPKCPLVNATMSTDKIEQIIMEEYEKTLLGNSDYDTVEKREASYQQLVMGTTSRTDVDKDKFVSELSEAGFYYVGPLDRVRCFSCGVMLSGIRLRSSKEMLIEHACVSSACAYVRSKLPQDRLDCILDTRSVSNDDCLVATFFVRTYDQHQTEWPSNMLCS